MKCLELMGIPEHDPDSPVALGRDGTVCDFREFKERIAALCSSLEHRGGQVVLYSADALLFAVGFLAAVEAGKRLYLPGFAGDGLFRDEELEGAVFLGDAHRPGFEAIDPETVAAGSAGTAGADAEPGIVLLTSGSTGEPKKINKDIRQLAAEVRVLAGLFGSRYGTASVCSTVSPQHIYGLLFSILVPLRLGAPMMRDRVEYPENLAALESRDTVLVSSPAFLKRLREFGDDGPEVEGIGTVFSSGGPLPPEAASYAEARFGGQVWEVFGSTETGGVAYRRIAETASWKPFEGIDVEINSDGHLVIRSDYLESRDPYTTQDLAEASDDGSFVLRGRSDSVVKIEEKRVSLNDVADRLCESPYVESARILLREDRRQYLGAVVICTDKGKERLAGIGRRLFIRELKEALSVHFAPVVLPRKWRFIEELPMNDMAKVNRSDLDALFAPRLEGYDYNIVDLNSREGRAAFLMRFPAGHEFFDGHFPDHPILPGVAQVYVVLRLCRKYLGLGEGYHGIPRMKFARPIEPGDELRLKCTLNRERGVLKYDYRTAGDGKLISSGSLKKETENHED